MAIKTIVKNQEQFNNAISQISGQEKVVVDVETSGLEVWTKDKICGIGVCLEDQTGFYFPYRHKIKSSALLDLFICDEVVNLELSTLSELFKALNSVKMLIGHNLKFDLAALYQDGFDLTDEQEIHDTIIGARMYFKDRFARLSLDNLSNKLLGPAPWKKEFHEYLKKNGLQNSFDYAPVDIVGEYCITDTQNTFECFQKLYEYAKETDQLEIWDQESRLLKVLWNMEKLGLYFDLDYCEDRIPKIRNSMAKLEEQMFDIWGESIDLGSEQQLTTVMQKIGITSSSTTKTGKPQWDQGELLTMKHPIGQLLLEWRGLEKQRSTYFEPLLEHKQNRRVHPSFKSWGTITGRLSCERPNLQNLTKGFIDLQKHVVEEDVLDVLKSKINNNKAGSGHNGPQGKAGTGSISGFMSYTKSYDDLDPETSISTRRLYIPPPDHFLYMIDFSQMEMRVFADYLNDPEVDKMLEDGADFHDIVAKEVWKIDKHDPMWKFYRTMAKCINFGLIYGIGVTKLAIQMQCSIDEAKEFKQRYFKRFKKAEQFIKAVNYKIITKGWIKNRFGRRYYIDQEGAYRGVNYLVQGTSADIVKNRMIACDEYLKDKRTNLVVQVHDELVFYVHKDEESFVVKDLKQIIEEKCIKTTLLSEVSKGLPSWAQKKTICVECMGLMKQHEDDVHDCATSKSILGI